MDVNVSVEVIRLANGKVRFRLEAAEGDLHADVPAADAVRLCAGALGFAGVSELRLPGDGTYVAQTRDGAVLEGRVNR
jgi:hypothetical protein